MAAARWVSSSMFEATKTFSADAAGGEGKRHCGRDGPCQFPHLLSPVGTGLPREVSKELFDNRSLSARERAVAFLSRDACLGFAGQASVSTPIETEAALSILRFLDCLVALRSVRRFGLIGQAFGLVDMSAGAGALVNEQAADDRRRHAQCPTITATPSDILRTISTGLCPRPPAP